MGIERAGNEVEDKKMAEKLDPTKKQEDISKKYPDLWPKEKGVLAGLDIPFDSKEGMTTEAIDKGMDARFDAEIQKAGISGKTPEITEGKKQLSEQIAKTTDMKEKIALYQEFLDSLSSGVGTAVAAEQKNQKDYTESLKKNEQDGDKQKRLWDLVREAQASNTRQNQEQKRQKVALEQKQRQEGIADATGALQGVDGWPGNMKESGESAKATV